MAVSGRPSTAALGRTEPGIATGSARPSPSNRTKTDGRWRSSSSPRTAVALRRCQRSEDRIEVVPILCRAIGQFLHGMRRKLVTLCNITHNEAYLSCWKSYCPSNETKHHGPGWCPVTEACIHARATASCQGLCRPDSKALRSGPKRPDAKNRSGSPGVTREMAWLKRPQDHLVVI